MGFLGFFAFDFSVDVFEFVKGRVYGAAFGDVAACHGEVGFLNFAFLKEYAESGHGFAVEGEHEYAGGGAINTVDRGNVLADLIA